MKFKRLPLILLVLCSCQAQTDLDRVARITWKSSLGILYAGTTADAASSWGNYEQNPLFRSADGKFGAPGLAKVIAMETALTVSQHYALKRLDGHWKVLFWSLAVTSNVFVSVRSARLAKQNMRIPKP